MDHRFKMAWSEETRRLFLAAHDDSFPEGSLKSGIGTMLTMFAKSLPGGFERWGEREQRHAMERFRPLGDRTHAHDYLVTAYRCIRLGHALASRSTAALSRSEARALGPRAAELGFRIDAEPAVEPPAPGPSFRVEFAYAYTGVPKGMRNERRFAATASTIVERASRDGFESAGRLPTPEGALDVLLRDGTWYRPVLGPGGWEPLTEAGFAAACAGGDPWRDDVFKSDRDAPLVAPMENRSDAPRRAVDREERLAAALARAGHLVSVEGVVYVETPPPTFHVVLRDPFKRSRSLALGWRLGRLTSEDDMGVVSSRRISRADWSSGSARDHKGFQSAYPTFPARGPSSALDLGRELSSSSGLAFEESLGAWVADDRPDRRLLLDLLGAMPSPAGTSRAVVELGRVARSVDPDGGSDAADALERAALALDSGREGMAVPVAEAAWSRLFAARFEATTRALGRVAARAIREGYDEEREDAAALAAFAP